MNVADLLAPVLDILDRPDIEDRLMQYMPKAIRAAHSIQKFTYDRSRIYIPTPTINNNLVTLSSIDLPLLRDIVGVAAYTSYTTAIISAETVYYPGAVSSNNFKNLNTGYDKTDYYGFAYQQGYMRLGSNVTLSGVDSSVTLLELDVLVWPSYELDEFAEEYSTNSWIAEQAPELIEAFLLVRGASIAQQDDVLRTAMTSLMTTTEEFLREKTGEIYGG